ncbi:hypothetical protein PG995_005841 [Apiospora arundinis]
MNDADGSDGIVLDVVTGWDEILGFRGHNQISQTFTLFPKLPKTLRCRIWRMTWNPHHIELPTGRMSTDDGDTDFDDDMDVSRLPKLAFPVSAHVNQESRSETLRMYHKIRDSPYVTFNTVINFEWDTIHMDHFCNRAAVYPDILFKKIERLNVSLHLMKQRYKPELQYPTPSEVPECWLKGCCLPVLDHETFDNFLHYILQRYFPKMKEIDLVFAVRRSEAHAESLNPLDFNPDIVPSLRPLFIRTTDGQGLEFVPSMGWVYSLNSIKIRVVKDHEAIERKDDENPTDHKAFLDFLGACFWNIFSPEWFLRGDKEVEQLIRQPRHTLW